VEHRKQDQKRTGCIAEFLCCGNYRQIEQPGQHQEVREQEHRIGLDKTNQSSITMKTVVKLGGGYYAVFEDNSIEPKIIYRMDRLTKNRTNKKIK